MSRLEIARFYMGGALLGSYGQKPGQTYQEFNAEVRRTADNISLEYAGAEVVIMREVNITI